MVKRNPNFTKLNAGYLFPEINKRKQAFLEKNPHAKLISLGIGDTTEPLKPHTCDGLTKGAQMLATKEGYTGYGPDQGDPRLREHLAERIYNKGVDSSEIFVSDGAKCDIGRLQILFGPQATIAVQDPVYPVYADTAVIMGMSGPGDAASGRYEGIIYMPCKPENNFFPDLNQMARSDIICFCSPNNPTGATATRKQLTELVQFAKKNKSIVFYDAAYAAFIRNPELPKSIYEIEGAREVAIELGSFSKMCGFTGVRLSWTVVPKELKFEDGHEVYKDWNRIHHTFYNGASNVAQHGGIAALNDAGWKEVQENIDFYLENARMIKELFDEFGYEVFGGSDIPFVWVRFPGYTSWEAFELFLNKAHIVTTPGSGFGASGEGFLRFSCFSHRENLIEAVRRIKEYLLAEKIHVGKSIYQQK